MYLQTLACRGYRNLAPLALTLAPDPIFLLGDNAQGKTNILEAIYLCATGRSFRHAQPKELIAHNALPPEAWVASRVSRQGVVHEVQVRIAPRRRTIRIDDKPLRSVASLLELVNV